VCGSKFHPEHPERHEEVPLGPISGVVFYHVLVMVHNGLKFLFDGVGDLSGEPDIGFQ
jgi:hypothetical protein